MGPKAEIPLVQRRQILIDLASEDTSVAQGFQGEMEAAQAGEQVDKAKRLRHALVLIAIRFPVWDGILPRRQPETARLRLNSPLGRRRRGPPPLATAYPLLKSFRTRSGSCWAMRVWHSQMTR